MKLTDIKPNPRNPRIIKDDKFEKLVQSLVEFPVMANIREVVLDEDNMILGGNMRYRAAKEAGWKEIPAKVFTKEDAKKNNELTGQNKTYEEYCDEFIIKDNVSGGEWDWDELGNNWNLAQLDEWGLDIPEFEEPEKEVEEDEAPELDEEVVSKLGEIYQLGNHRIMCGSSTEEDDVKKLMNGNIADMVFTDPPYGVSYSGVAGSKKWEVIENDDLRQDGLVQFLVAAMENAYNYSKDETGLYCWFSSKNHVEFREALKATGWEFKEELIWNKGMSLSGADYQYAHEPVLYCQKDGHKAQWYGGRDKKTILRQRRTDLMGLKKEDLLKMVLGMQSETTVWEIDREKVTLYQHPTQKPNTLAARAIQNSSLEGEIVLDLFLGSGSTLMACEQTNRVCYGMELDPKYCDVIRKRYAKWIQVDDQLPENWEELTPAIK